MENQQSKNQNLENANSDICKCDSPTRQELPKIPVESHLAMSILIALFCCLPFGIIAVIYSCKTNSAAKYGDYESAYRYSAKAQTWDIIGIVIGIFYILSIILFQIVNIANAVSKLNVNN